MQGVLAVSGIIGTWAGPRSAGTAFVMAHHKIGDIGDGQLASWGFPAGGMGAVSDALRSAAESFGAVVRTDAPVHRILVRNGRATGVVLQSGEEIRADVVIAATHPKLTFLEHIDRSELPDDFVADIERWKSRSGAVKVNLALDRLPDFSGKPGFDPEVHGGTIVLADSLDEIEGAFQDAVAGRPGGGAVRRHLHPLRVRPVTRTRGPARDVDVHAVGAAPVREQRRDVRTELGARRVRRPGDRRVEQVAPGFTASILHRQVIGPYEMEHEYGLIGGNIFHGELSADQMFHMRPAPGYADFRTPIAGLYQASSATHGGGGVTGNPGSQRRFADRRRPSCFGTTARARSRAVLTARVAHRRIPPTIRGAARTNLGVTRCPALAVDSE